VEDACRFIDKHIPLRSKLESGSISRTTKKEYPLIAIREALINALTHRNYFDSADVRVFIFPDSMEIINPGGFPPGVTPTEPIHKPRNPLISQYFFDLGYIEKYGMGLRRMIQACRNFGMEPPEFDLKESETKVIFFAPGNDDIKSRILSMVDRNGSVKSGEIVRTIGVSRDTANRHLNRLLNEGKLKRVGKGRAVKYVR
jgi:ATP-dependent DNA helicase RecG